MAGEGQLLRTARENKEWSLTDTEEITKIRVRYIQALEEENYGILPGPTYAKGYLRTYAKQLGLNSDEIIALYSATLTPDVASAPPVLKTLQVSPKSRPLWVRPAIIGGVAVLMLIAYAAKGLYSPENAIPDTPYTAPPLISAPKTDTATTSPPPSASESSLQTTPPNAQDGLTAQLVFTQPCWIEVRIDGQAPFQGTFAAGTSKEVKGTEKIELVSIGNAGGLTVTLNGRALPMLGKAGEVRRNVVLTKDMLNQL
ncbi:RodZ domain-containing protein [Desulfosporosinus sp. BICA1-9]|uniref:helix-turn-helix domain-containing protein n=1 Tax=Desulfosporosinus sp. BICA1-9 TaxID=1531958 RepID=UPI00054BD343|nr:RodZ domain-containing protein [Desulfosporosinus sp. BICA1-9]KJS49616.1 MAG: XRE family transcriptional regulator [Peptococcaceae bacterium BRH_c23]KJS77898.1 MAG: XRE family transcriptional regulator [Desulfosporosinus sp. BICA1-9]